MNFRDILHKLARLGGRAQWARSKAELAEIREQAEGLASSLRDSTDFTTRRWGEIKEAIERDPWVENLIGALAEQQEGAPRDENHRTLVLLRNVAGVIADALEESRGRGRERIIADQFRVGRRLAREFVGLFIPRGKIFETELDPGDVQRIGIAAMFAFFQRPSIASPAPFRRLLALLDECGVPSAEGLIDLGEDEA